MDTANLVETNSYAGELREITPLISVVAASHPAIATSNPSFTFQHLLDAIEADPKLAGNFREVDSKRVEDIKESNWGSWRHTSTHYFAGTQFRRVLRESIGIS